MSEDIKPEVAQPESPASAFLAEYGDLVKKHGFDFASYPVYVPDGQGAFKTVIQSTPVDVSGAAKASPFVAEEK